MFDKSDERPVYECYMTQERIDQCRKYECCGAEVLEALPYQHDWPKGVVVEETKSSSGRCYAEVHYAVTSPRELTDDDFDVLRAQGAFMNGQECGLVCGKSVSPEGIHTYRLRSICDSSD